MLYAFRHPDCATLLLTQTDPAERTPRMQAVIRCDRTANSDGCPQRFCETFPNVVRRGMSNKRERRPSLRSGRHLINVCASALPYILRKWHVWWRARMVKAHSACAQTECNVRVNVRSICLWTKCWSDYGGHKVCQQLRTLFVRKLRTCFKHTYSYALTYALRFCALPQLSTTRAVETAT